MKISKKLFSVFLVFSFAASAQDPKGMQGGMAGGVSSGYGGGGNPSQDYGQESGMDSYNPGGTGGQRFISPRGAGQAQLVLPDVRMESNLCTFGMGDEVSQDDRLLLTSARQMASSLRNNSEQCRQSTQQSFDAFDASVQDFNNFNDTSRPLNPDSPIQASCSNFERFYDIQYDQFVNTSSNTEVRDMFSGCRGKPEAEAFACAQQLISSARIQKRNTCETSREFISAQRSSQLQVDTLRAGVAILTSMINNDECIGEDPNQRMNIIQSAVSLASRAASLSVVGSPMALGIGAVTGLLQSAIGRLFRRGNRDPYVADQNQQNFEKVACLYEQIETKARRCERDASEQYTLRERSRFEQSTRACEVLGDVSGPENLYREISAVIGGLAPRPGDAGASGFTANFSETFNSLMERLVTPTSQLGGDGETPLSVGLQSAQDVVNNIDLMLAPDSPHLDTYMSAKNGGQPLTNPARNRERSRLREEKTRAESLKNLLTLMDQVGNSSNQTPEDLSRVQTAMSQFDGGSLGGNPLNFAGAFNQMLSMRAELSDEVGNRIDAWRNRLSQFQLHRDVIDRYNQNRSRSNAQFNDAGSFQNQVNMLRPYLSDQMQTELRRLSQNAQTIVEDTSRENVTNNRNTTAENILWPMVRACNLLQSVENENDVCSKLSCANGSGVKTFAHYLARNSGNQECTSQSCPAEYNTFICQNKGTGVTAAIGNHLKNEYVANGTICGRPWNEVFRR